MAVPSNVNSERKLFGSFSKYLFNINEKIVNDLSLSAVLV